MVNTENAWGGEVFFQKWQIYKISMYCEYTIFGDVEYGHVIFVHLQLPVKGEFVGHFNKNEVMLNMPLKPLSITIEVIALCTTIYGSFFCSWHLIFWFISFSHSDILFWVVCMYVCIGFIFVFWWWNCVLAWPLTVLFCLYDLKNHAVKMYWSFGWVVFGVLTKDDKLSFVVDMKYVPSFQVLENYNFQLGFKMKKSTGNSVTWGWLFWLQHGTKGTWYKMVPFWKVMQVMSVSYFTPV